MNINAKKKKVWLCTCLAILLAVPSLPCRRLRAGHKRDPAGRTGGAGGAAPGGSPTGVYKRDLWRRAAAKDDGGSLHATGGNPH